VPIARLAAAQAAIKDMQKPEKKAVKTKGSKPKVQSVKRSAPQKMAKKVVKKTASAKASAGKAKKKGRR
jgi:hypothetical protein